MMDVMLAADSGWWSSLPFVDQPNPWVSFLLTAAAVIILGIAKSGFGGGVGVVAVPMFALALGAQQGTATLLPLLIAADIFSVWHHWGTWDKRTLAVLTPGSLVGIVVGSVLLWVLVTAPGGGKLEVGSSKLEEGAATAGAVGDGKFEVRSSKFEEGGGTAGAVETQAAPATAVAPAAAGKGAKQQGDDALNMVTGIVAVLYVVLDQIRARFAPSWHFRANHKSGFAAGLAVGVVSTVSHAAGPIAAIFLLGQGMARQAFIGTTVIYFFGVNTIKLIPYAIIPGMLTGGSLWTGLWLLPLVPVGTAIGAWMNRRMSEGVFRGTIMVIVLITGVQLIVETVTGVKLVQMVLQVGG